MRFTSTHHQIGFKTSKLGKRDFVRSRVPRESQKSVPREAHRGTPSHTEALGGEDFVRLIRQSACADIPYMGKRILSGRSACGNTHAPEDFVRGFWSMILSEDFVRSVSLWQHACARWFCPRIFSEDFFRSVGLCQHAFARWFCIYAPYMGKRDFFRRSIGKK